MTPSTRSKLTVLSLFALLGLGLAIVWIYRDERGDLGPLAELRCEAIDKTLLQLGAGTRQVTRDQACRALRSLAAIAPDTVLRSDGREAGSLLVAAGAEVWQVALIASGEGSRIDRCSLRRRRGAGWSVVAEYPAAPVLAALDLPSRLDSSGAR